MDPACQVVTVQSHVQLLPGRQYAFGVFSLGSFWHLYTNLSKCNLVHRIAGRSHPSIHLCCTVIHMEMKYSSKTTALLAGPCWLLPGWRSIPLTSLS
ncbi:hypothetical protein NPIL_349181 [Nephila pilipes]|uniref:Uncharacterized protein n=1 Tax=Nephila pilipes TaxID=299642 RepID=A0A8X6UT53_NEPPI|nr:hypothetical protein NPIL_349181 [Nephila pilipes]